MLSASAPVFSAGSPWRLHPQVVIRPEPFGALLYHFGNRKLSFLKNHTIVNIVQSLADYPNLNAACVAAGINDAATQSYYFRAFNQLAQSQMIVPA
ncbi:MAG: mycofactocin biosynthesis chaperone MftB [Mycobacteriaceae bacterium]